MENIPFLGTAIVSMTLALVFYSLGTWAERVQKILKFWHIVCFCLGLVADSFGTVMMADVAGGKMDLLHGSTGMLALILMAVHAMWAILTYWRGSVKAKQNFSKFSVCVWVFWLIPYVLGIFLGMSH